MQEMQDTQGLSLGWEDLLQKEVAAHPMTLAWKIPWTEEPGGLQSMGSRRARHNWVTEHNTASYLSFLCVEGFEKYLNAGALSPAVHAPKSPSEHSKTNRLKGFRRSPWRRMHFSYLLQLVWNFFNLPVRSWTVFSIIWKYSSLLLEMKGSLNTDMKVFWLSQHALS